MKSFKILGLLLTYPRADLYGASADLVALLRREALLPEKATDRIVQFLNRQRRKDLLETQVEYVETFDRGRAHSLHLFEHVHGESRDRGQAMVNLSETYASRGLYIGCNELPDYLPLFMEYLSRCPFGEARALLAEAIDLVAMIGTRLRARQSPYAAVFEAIEALSAARPDKARIRKAMQAAPKDPETLEELDEEWKEAEAFGGDPMREAMPSCGACASFPNTTQMLEKAMGGMK